MITYCCCRELLGAVQCLSVSWLTTTLEHSTTNMADLDDFFAKKDKKKKGTKKFSQANTDVIAKNLEETAIKEQIQQDKDITNIGDEMNPESVNQQVGREEVEA